MFDVSNPAQFERRLRELGCPARYLRQYVLELSDHHQDLKEAALAEGLSDPEAQAQADALLGEPSRLADNLIFSLRQRSWPGRHPTLAFCVLPPLLFIPAWLGCATALWGVCQLLGRVFGAKYLLNDAAMKVWTGDPELARQMTLFANHGVTPLVTLLMTLGLFYLLRRLAFGFGWFLLSAICLAISGGFCIIHIGEQALNVGYRWPPFAAWHAIIPLLAAALVYLKIRRPGRRLLWIKKLKATPARAGRTTPTFWIACACATALLALVTLAGVISWLENRQADDLADKVWPVERAATLARLKMRQAIPVLSHCQAIDLRPVANASLADSTDGPATGRTQTAASNNLSELAPGWRHFGGVPFNIQGKVQLAGALPPVSQNLFPARVSIPIARRCDRICLLHGACNVGYNGQTAASLLLHYVNGTRAVINLVAGEDLMDWWGPIYKTQAPHASPHSPKTVLAWTGSNPGIRQNNPDFSLRLFQSTFANPHPQLEIASIEYASTLSGAAPFLVAMTVTTPIP